MYPLSLQGHFLVGYSVNLLRTIIVVAIVLFVGGCRIELIAPEGGYVTTQSGNHTCQSGANCVIEVGHTSFDETFTAVPNPGYFFYSWSTADRAFCPRSVEDCQLSTTAFRGNEKLMAVLESDEFFLLEPIFKLGECEDLSDQWTETIGEKEVQFRSAVPGCPGYAGRLEPHGVMRLWQDAMLVAESRWLAGSQQGRELEWWPNGNIKAQYRWEYGARHGWQRQYRENGTLWREEKYYSDMLHGESRNYDKEGKLNGLQTFFENILHGRELIFYDSGPLKLRRNYKLGQMQGMQQTYQEDGILLDETHHVNGKPLGPYKTYDSSGDLIEEGHRPVFLRESDLVVRDNNLGIRWARDANLFKTLCDQGHALTNSFSPVDADNSVAICAANGAMTWNDAKLWADHLGANSFGGYQDWRLPAVSPDATQNWLSVDGEFDQLYHMSLNNPGWQYTDCHPYSDYVCLQNPGPFINIQGDVYWSGSLHPVWEDAYFFQFAGGKRDSDNFENLFYVWPVTP
jgi:antitoxin component YwqK of YwqJK toxin-antitoxin module